MLLVVEAAFAGVGRHVLDIAERLAAKGDVVDVAYGAERADDRFVERLGTLSVRHSIPLTGGRALGMGDLRANVEVRRAIRRHGPYDIVHGHASKGGAHARLSAPRRVTSLLYTPNALVTQSPELGRVGRLLYTAAERALSYRTDGFIHVSPEEERHARAIGLAPRLSRLVPNGIPMEPLPTRADARRELGLDDGSLVIGFVGRLSRQKGVDVLLQSAAMLPSAAPWTLAIIGTGEEGESLRQMSSRLGIADHVRWLGARPGQESMPAFDVLAVPSRYEGFPYVILEGLWAGLPLIATAGCGAELVLGDGRVGVLTDGSPEAIADAMSTMLADIDARGERSARCQEVVMPFSLARMVDDTRTFYLDVHAARDRDSGRRLS